MAYRFPGMNPYLEHPALWPEVHKRLIIALADVLNPLINPTYRVAIEERVYEADADALLVGIPDNLVLRSEATTRQGLPDALETTATATLTAPKVVQLPQIVTVRQWYLEVRRTSTKEVVTIIEILSPTNKRSGEGRQEYLRKRQRILNSRTHLIEIDLLRQYQPMPLAAGNPQKLRHYRILVSRSEHRPQALLYEFDLRQPIPIFTLPLTQVELEMAAATLSDSPAEPPVTEPPVTEPPVAEPQVILQPLLEMLYDRAGFDLDIDYSQQPLPDLTETDWAWVQQLRP